MVDLSESRGTGRNRDRVAEKTTLLAIGAALLYGPFVSEFAETGTKFAEFMFQIRTRSGA